MSNTEHANHIANRAHRMANVIPDIEAHLIAEQTAALIEGTDTENGMPGPSGTSDPTGSLVANAIDNKHSVYSRMRARQDSISDALNGIDRALDHLDRTAKNALSAHIDYDTSSEPRCPGYTIELRTRLGGCGNQLDGYKRSDGTKAVRQYCLSCRKLDEADRRHTEAEVA